MIPGARRSPCSSSQSALSFQPHHRRCAALSLFTRNHGHTFTAVRRCVCMCFRSDHSLQLFVDVSSACSRLFCHRSLLSVPQTFPSRISNKLSTPGFPCIVLRRRHPVERLRSGCPAFFCPAFFFVFSLSRASLRFQLSCEYVVIAASGLV